MPVISKTVADLRNTFRAAVPCGPVLVRPSNYTFYEFDEPYMTAVIDDVERLFVRNELGDPPTKLEQFALTILAESYF